MSKPNDPKLSLKVVMNKQKTKVLFAEANTDFINVLLSFLALPLGKVIKILLGHDGEETPAIGSLNNLYTSLFNLDGTFFCIGGAKQMLLNPPSSLRAQCHKLALDITDRISSNNQYFLCQDQNCPKFEFENISLYSGIAKCDCGKLLNREIRVAESLDNGDFITTPSLFIITDDLSVEPMTGIIHMLNNLGSSDTQGAEMMNVSVGVNEIRDLLKFSLTSATPLTDVIIKKSQMCSIAVSPKSGIFFHHIPKENANSKKMVLKLCLQRSANKFLFAVATDEFVELLLSFLTIPLGGVEFLLGGRAGLNSIDNLYRSASNSIDDEYFTTPETKTELINPKLHHGYISKNQFLPLKEVAPPILYYQRNWNHLRQQNELSFHEKKGKLVPSFKLNKELYVKKQTMCIVNDDLTFSPSFATSLSIINSLGINLSDVKEMEVQIGLEEALRILKASLTSKTALTDALINPMQKLERQPKQEPS